MPREKSPPADLGDTRASFSSCDSGFNAQGDVLMVIPVLPASFRSVVTVRRALLTIADFANQLEKIQPQALGANPPLSTAMQIGTMDPPSRTHTHAPSSQTWRPLPKARHGGHRGACLGYPRS